MIRIVEVLEATEGGTRRHLLDAVDALAIGDFEVRIVCAERRDPLFREDIETLRRAGHPVHVLPMTRQLHPPWDMISYFKLGNILRRHPCDILHLHSSKAGFLGRIRKPTGAARIIYSPHCFPFCQRVNPLLRRLYEGAERHASRHTDLLLAVSSAERNLAIQGGLFPAAKATVLHNAVDVDRLEGEAGARPPDRPVSPLVFGFLGMLTPQKAPLDFLDAARRLLALGGEARFLLPSKGWLLPKVKRYISHYGLGEHVQLVAPPRPFARYYRLFDVGVLPSLWEGLSYSLLEALALRLPVLASRIPGNEEVVRPLGEDPFVPPSNPVELANRMAAWLDRPIGDLVDWGERGRKLVATNYRLDQWGEALRRIYRSLASSGSGLSLLPPAMKDPDARTISSLS